MLCRRPSALGCRRRSLRRSLRSGGSTPESSSSSGRGYSYAAPSSLRSVTTWSRVRSLLPATVCTQPVTMCATGAHRRALSRQLRHLAD
eukprot:scaffold23436_cov68-Phaeocystis_antarctica.AAC.9